MYLKGVFMVKAVATSTEFKNKFGHFLNIALNGGEIIVTKNGKEVGRFIPSNTVTSFLSESLLGIIDDDETDYREESLKSKYEIND